MKHLKYQIDGSFGKKKIDVDLRVTKSSNRLIILLHGSFGYTYHLKKTKYEVLSEKLYKTCSVGFYQTSRNFEWRQKPNLTFEEYREASFNGKTFEKEFLDVKNAVKEIIAKVKMETGRQKLEITFVGFSLGGIMSFLLLDFFSNVKNIFTFGTAIEFRNLDRKLSLIKGIPKAETIRKYVSRFKGNIILVRGTEDELTTFEKMLAIYKSAVNAKSRTLIELNGVDHRFVTASGQNEEKELIEKIFNLVKMQAVSMY